ncbi:hypothetical protein [Williamsia sterculiae]|uniref:Uncharacterized protein n=1 Tax=Williamsia sterculiae TaxID=1344003 RepID=A0A1N7GQJ8_9NOCA|nr:hypothetical protein [Williamsia sterculiae]SIS14852.1 hypothetical protein SAMN05445060_2999 [Williamsia sterculiae]
MTQQLRPRRRTTVTHAVCGPDRASTLADLVSHAADAAHERPALTGPDYTVSFGELRARTAGVASVMSPGDRSGDSALTVALMTAIPGLALAGPQRLADTLSSIRTEATTVLAQSRLR